MDAALLFIHDLILWLCGGNLLAAVAVELVLIVWNLIAWLCGHEHVWRAIGRLVFGPPAAPLPQRQPLPGDDDWSVPCRVVDGRLERPVLNPDGSLKAWEPVKVVKPEPEQPTQPAAPVKPPTILKNGVPV